MSHECFSLLCGKSFCVLNRQVPISRNRVTYCRWITTRVNPTETRGDKWSCATEVGLWAGSLLCAADATGDAAYRAHILSADTDIRPISHFRSMVARPCRYLRQFNLTLAHALNLALNLDPESCCRSTGSIISARLISSGSCSRQDVENMTRQIPGRTVQFSNYYCWHRPLATLVGSGFAGLGARAERMKVRSIPCRISIPKTVPTGDTTA